VIAIIVYYFRETGARLAFLLYLNQQTTHNQGDRLNIHVSLWLSLLLLRQGASNNYRRLLR
jgi:hypothetical protein